VLTVERKLAKKDFQRISVEAQKSFVFLSLIFLSGCKFGGAISGGIENVPQPVASVDVPILTTPSTTPYFSNTSALTLSGYCGKNTSVSLKGSATQTQSCTSNGTFSFLIERNIDGIYSFALSQKNIHNQISESIAITWIRKTSVPPPSLTNPATPNFSSGLSTIALSGTCETGNKITLDGDASGDTTCSNSAFSINVSKAQFGTYNIDLIQEDRAGNTATLALVWNRVSLDVSPTNATLPVATSQVITINGGDGNYTVVFDNNNSGATFNPSNRTYTSGTTANVTDNLRVTDGDGLEGLFSFTTLASTPDHFEFDAWPEPTVDIGTESDNPISLKIVDRFGNGVPNIPVLFQSLYGDLSFLSNPVQNSNSLGEIAIDYKMGHNLKAQKIKISTLSQTLPDEAGTENDIVNFTLNSLSHGNGNFGPFYSLGSNPRSLKSHDFDGDGFQDLAFVNNGNNEFVVKKGKADGLFRASVKYPLTMCSDATQVLLGDFDGDSQVDALVLCSGSDTLARLKGQPDGTFTVLPSIGGISSQETFVAHDFNDDGNLDIAIVSSANNQVQIFSGTGNFEFSHLTTLNTGAYPKDIQLSDIDGNGFMDLVVTNNQGNSITIFKNSGLPNFNLGLTIPVGAGPTQVKLGDLNNNSHPDLVVINQDEWSAMVFLNDTEGGFDFSSNVSLGDGPSNLELIDYDGDSNLDVLVSNNNDQNFGVLLGQGNGVFQDMTNFDSMGPVSSLLVSDINTDSLPDLLFINSATEELNVLPANSNGGFGNSINLAQTPISSGSADFDQDGIEDLYFLNSNNTVSFYRGIGNGKYEFQTSLATGSSPIHAVVVDLNSDSWPDILIANNVSHTFTLYYGGENWNFSSRNDFPTTLNPTALTVGDFNGDGLLDVAASGTGTSRVSVSLGSSDTIFGAKTDYNSGNAPQDIKSADLNGDGFIDLITANQSGDSISIFLGNGDGTFRTALSVDVGASPTRVSIDDFNRDGALDIVTLNTGDGGIAYLRGNGDGTFVSPVSYFAGGTPVDMKVADLNGDGYTDIVVSNGFLNSLTVLFNANGTFNTTKTINTDFTIDSLFLKDLNGDGSIDLKLINNATSKATLWHGH
jgi:hypothetical protein